MATLSRVRALGLIAAGMALAPRTAYAQTPPLKIRVGSVPADTYAGAYYALELGLFEKAGLNVEIMPFTNGAAMAAAAAGGSIDIGVGDAAELANGIGRGIPFVLIAGGGLYSSAAPTTTLCISKTSSIAKAADLEGQNVAVVSLVSLMSSAVKGWLTTNGADVNKVHFVEMPFPQMPGALSRGALSAATLSEPIMSDATSTDAKFFGKPYDAIAKSFNISDWFTTREWLAKNPDAAKKFVGAIYDAARWANAHHDESAVILAKYTKVDVERIKRMNRSTYATDLQKAMVQPVLDTAFKYKSLAAATTADSMIAKGF